MNEEVMNKWFVYILRCADNSLYTGITTDIERRVKEHNDDNRRAAAYTRARRPLELVYSESHESRSKATKRELEIKKLSRIQKQTLFSINKT